MTEINDVPPKGLIDLPDTVETLFDEVRSLHARREELAQERHALGLTGGEGNRLGRLQQVQQADEALRVAAARAGDDIEAVGSPNEKALLDAWAVFQRKEAALFGSLPAVADDLKAAIIAAADEVHAAIDDAIDDTATQYEQLLDQVADIRKRLAEQLAVRGFINRAQTHRRGYINYSVSYGNLPMPNEYSRPVSFKLAIEAMREEAGIARTSPGPE